MRLSRGWLALLFLPSLVGTCAPLGAQPLDRSGSGALTGTFVSADTLQVVVRTDDDALVTFSVEGQASVPPGLVPGMRVTVRYAVGDGGRYRVVRVGIASFPPEPGSTTLLPPPAAEAASPAPPAASPSPPPAAAAPPPSTVARRVPSEVRPPAVVELPRASRKEPAALTLAPAAEEPPGEPAPPPELTPAGIVAPAEPSSDRTTAHLLKVGGLALMAGGLLALAYAFLRGRA